MGGAIVPLPSGEEAVHVSLQVGRRLPMSSRRELHSRLEQVFGHVAKALADEGGRVDLETISDLAQSVEATLPLESYEPLVKRLRDEDIRVDPLVRRQAVSSG